MKKYIFMIIAILVIITGCNQKDDNYKEEEMEKNADYKKISQDEAYQMMQTGDVIILDVREQEEYDSGHIVGAQLMPVGQIEAELEGMFSNKEATYLVYCRSGNRSKTASKIMLELGYKNVFDFGGINTWKYDTKK